MEDLATKATRVIELAREKNATVATAESCTGGLVAHCLTEVPGSSAVFCAGWVCYSNAAKIRDLSVASSALEQEGAVSEVVAMALAEGARRRGEVDLAVSTSGIAGPTGGRPGKPVGLMWCALAASGGSFASKVLVEGEDRSATKRAFAARALEMLHEALTRRD